MKEVYEFNSLDEFMEENYRLKDGLTKKNLFWLLKQFFELTEDEVRSNLLKHS